MESAGSPVLQYTAGGLANLAIVADGMHYGWPSPSLPQILNNTVHPLYVSNEEGLWMAVMPLIGSVFGSVTAATTVDYCGRKKTILGTAVPFFVSWLMIAVANSTVWLHAARFLAGMAGGVAFTAVPMYLGEIADAKVRGVLGSSCAAMWVVGFLSINVIGSYLSIRNTAIIFSLLPVIAFFTFLWMPESSYYLLMRNKGEEARKTLRKFRRRENIDDELERMASNLQSKVGTSGRFLDLFLVKSNRKAFLIIAGLRGFQQFSGATAITFYTQTIFKEAGDNISAHHGSIIYFTVQLFMTILSSSIVDKTGRKPLLIISITGSAITLFLEGLFFYLKSYTHIDTSSFDFLPVVILIFFVIIFSVGMQSVPILILGELFPTSVKAFALCLADIYFCVVATLASKFLQVMKDIYGIYMAFYGFSLFAVLGLIFIIFCVPETKGKNLEEIQAFLQGRNVVHDHSQCNEEECVKVSI